MAMSYIKLKAKNRLVKNYFQCFIASALPYATFVLLSLLNYYLYMYLKNTDFTSISSYASFLRPSILTVSLIISFIVWRTARLLTDRYFYVKNHNPDATFIEAVRGVTFRQFITASMATVLKFFLGIAWATLYLMPCAVMSGIFAYALKYEAYNRNLFITLFASSVMLFFIGVSFLYVTMKRYTMTDAVIFDGKEKDSLKAIEKSIKIMEGNTLKYSLYCLSFLGWMLSCLLVLPIFYVLPYKTMAKYSFYSFSSKSTFFKHESEKPIIFYITKTVKE